MPRDDEINEELRRRTHLLITLVPRSSRLVDHRAACGIAGRVLRPMQTNKRVRRQMRRNDAHHGPVRACGRSQCWIVEAVAPISDSDGAYGAPWYAAARSTRHAVAHATATIRATRWPHGDAASARAGCDMGATCLYASNHSFSAALKQELRNHVVCGRRARFVDTVGVADRDENCHAFTSAR